MRERLTYKFVLQLFGLLLLLAFGLIWVSGNKITIGETEFEPDAIVFILGIVGSILLLVIPLFFPRLISDAPIFIPKDKPLSEDIRRKNRQLMLDKVERIWIKGYLDPVLNEMKSLKLDLTFAEPEKVLLRPGMSKYVLPDSTHILKIFNELNRRLIILGDKGAGKTVVMLQLARALIQEASDANKPIPIILALSSWAARPRPFEEWLRDEVREKYGLNRKVADDLVKGEQLLYLLDGLDEVAETQRDACLQAVHQFLDIERPNVTYVLCSRRAEFESLPTRLNVKGEIVLQALTTTQIDGYLRGSEFKGLRILKSRNSILQNFATVPFMLNTMAIVTRGKSNEQIERELGILDTEIHARDAFLEAYIYRRQGENINDRYPDARRTRKQLKWLAQQLVQGNETDFFIEYLAADALNERERKIYVSIVTTIFTMPFILFVVLTVPIGDRILTIMSLTAPLLGLILGFLLSTGMFKPLYKLRWRLTPFAKLLGFQFGVIMSIVYGLSYGAREGFAGLFVPLAIGLISGMVVSLITGFEGYETVAIRVEPNSGFKQSLSNFMQIIGVALFVSVIWGTVLSATTGVIPDSGSVMLAVAFGLSYGVVSGTFNGGFFVVQHCFFRVYLTYKGYMPLLRYDKFLDYCAEELIILRKVGGGYRFVHDYMRLYLASDAFVPDSTATSVQD